MVYFNFNYYISINSIMVLQLNFNLHDTLFILYLINFEVNFIFVNILISFIIIIRMGFVSFYDYIPNLYYEKYIYYIYIT